HDGRKIVRREPPALVATACADRKRGAGPVAEQVDGGSARRLGRLFDHKRRMKEIDAQHVPCALGELVDRSPREHRENASTLAELERAEIAKQPLDVTPQLRVEEHTVT